MPVCSVLGPALHMALGWVWQVHGEGLCTRILCNLWGSRAGVVWGHRVGPPRVVLPGPWVRFPPQKRRTHP